MSAHINHLCQERYPIKYITAKQALTPEGWEENLQIGIGPDGTIAYVGPVKTENAQSIPLLLPSPSNLHSHSFQRAMAGLTEMRGPDPKDSFWTWRRLMYRFLDQFNPDHVETIAALVFMEMLEAGYSSVGEFHYLHHAPGGMAYAERPELCQRIVSAAETTGIGLTLLPVLYQQGGCDGRPLEGGQRRFENSVEQFAELFAGASRSIEASHADYVIGVAPHSLRAVSKEGLNAATDLCQNGPVHMHLAEQISEVEEVEAHLGARPVEWLLDKYNINERWCLVHCTQMNMEETVRLAESGAVAGLCPITESSLGDGIFNATTYLGAGGTFGVGSDSNVHVSLFDELETLEYSQRLRDHSRAALASGDRSTGRVLFGESLKGGAQALARNSGAIKTGMLADLMGIETDNQWLCGRAGDTFLDSLIFGGHARSCISNVWSAGRHVVKDGHHVERAGIINKYKNTIAELGSDI